MYEWRKHRRKTQIYNQIPDNNRKVYRREKRIKINRDRRDRERTGKLPLFHLFHMNSAVQLRENVP